MSLIDAILAGVVLVGSKAHNAPLPPAAPVPISGPVTITASGSYIVTRDFTASGQPAIKLSGEVDATIDFAGHTVTGNVLLRAFIDDTERRTLTLRGGTLASGTIGVSPNQAAETRLIADHMTFDDASIAAEDAAVSVRSSLFDNAIATIETDLGRSYADFQDNRVIGGSLYLGGVSGGPVRGNVFQGGSILVYGSGGVPASNLSIDGNSIWGGNILIGAIGYDGTSAIELGRNYVSGYILVEDSFQPWIYQNVVGGCNPSGASIEVGFGRSGQIEDNRFDGRCRHGIWFRDVSRENEYAGNAFRTYVPQPVLDEGAGNWDGSRPAIGPE